MSLLYENEIKYKNKYGLIAGVDEAGRGPIAGPLVVCACILPEQPIIEQLNDSKMLSEKVRELIFSIIISSAIDYQIAIIEPEDIDKLNILQATLNGMESAVKKLRIQPDYILIDGNKIPAQLLIKAEAVVKGDSKIASIAAASIIAKVTRDRIMKELDLEFPLYKFAKHKGYPTKDHLNAINKYGICDYHRKSYRPVKMVIEGCQEQLLFNRFNEL